MTKGGKKRTSKTTGYNALAKKVKRSLKGAGQEEARQHIKTLERTKRHIQAELENAYRSAGGLVPGSSIGDLDIPIAKLICVCLKTSPEFYYQTPILFWGPLFCYPVWT